MGDDEPPRLDVSKFDKSDPTWRARAAAPAGRSEEEAGVDSLPLDDLLDRLMEWLRQRYKSREDGGRAMFVTYTPPPQLKFTASEQKELVSAHGLSKRCTHGMTIVNMACSQRELRKPRMNLLKECIRDHEERMPTDASLPLEMSSSGKVLETLLKAGNFTLEEVSASMID